MTVRNGCHSAPVVAGEISTREVWEKLVGRMKRIRRARYRRRFQEDHGLPDEILQSEVRHAVSDHAPCSMACPEAITKAWDFNCGNLPQALTPEESLKARQFAALRSFAAFVILAGCRFTQMGDASRLWPNARTRFVHFRGQDIQAIWTSPHQFAIDNPFSTNELLNGGTLRFTFSWASRSREDPSRRQ